MLRNIVNLYVGPVGPFRNQFCRFVAFRVIYCRFIAPWQYTRACDIRCILDDTLYDSDAAAQPCNSHCDDPHQQCLQKDHTYLFTHPGFIGFQCLLLPGGAFFTVIHLSASFILSIIAKLFPQIKEKVLKFLTGAESPRLLFIICCSY